MKPLFRKVDGLWRQVMTTSKPHLRMRMGSINLVHPGCEHAIRSDWHPAKVKAELEMKGTNLSQLARSHGYRHINEVLYRSWLAAEQIVAKALGEKPEAIWPSRYKLPRERAKLLTRNVVAKQLHTSALCSRG
jgi:Ner family transcriptional regulator